MSMRAQKTASPADTLDRDSTICDPLRVRTGFPDGGFRVYVVAVSCFSPRPMLEPVVSDGVDWLVGAGSDGEWGGFVWSDALFLSPDFHHPGRSVFPD